MYMDGCGGEGIEGGVEQGGPSSGGGGGGGGNKPKSKS